jgi:hypothetical protein
VDCSHRRQMGRVNGTVGVKLPPVKTGWLPVPSHVAVQARVTRGPQDHKHEWLRWQHTGNRNSGFAARHNRGLAEAPGDRNRMGRLRSQEVRLWLRTRQKLVNLSLLYCDLIRPSLCQRLTVIKIEQLKEINIDQASYSIYFVRGTLGNDQITICCRQYTYAGETNSNRTMGASEL